MSSTLSHGLPATLLAASLYGLAPVAQGVAATRAAPARGLGIGLAARLLIRPLWLAGLACEIGGFLIEAYAFSQAPAAMVAPLLACDVLVFVVLAGPALHDRPARLGFVGVLVMMAGVGLLAYSFSSVSHLGRPAGATQLLTVSGIGLAVSVIGVLLGRRSLQHERRWLAAIAYGVSAGTAYGLATLTTRQIGLTFSRHHVWDLLSTPTPYLLTLFSAIAVVTLQQGLQVNALLAYPTTSMISAFLPVVLGTLVLSDAVPQASALAVFVVALLSVALGVVLLGRDRAAAERRSRQSPEPGTPAEVASGLPA